MIIQIPTNMHSRHLARAAYQASADFNCGRITQDEAYRKFDLYGEVLNMMEKRATPTREEGYPAGV